MCTYLTKRGATYYFRRVIPVELRPAFGGRAEFMVSLRTKDREDAKRLIPGHTIATDKQLDDALAGRGAVMAAIPPGRSPWASEAAMEASLSAAEDDAERDARWDGRALLRERLEAAFERSTAEITPTEAAMRDILRDQIHEFTVAEERRMIRRVARAEDRRGGIPSVSSVEAPQSPVASPTPDGAGTMLDTTVVGLWAAERKVSKKGEDTHRRVAEWFYKRVGRKPVADITRKDVLAFKLALVSEGQTPANIKMKLSRLRTLLQWAADNDHAASNVATGITIKDTDAAKNKRKEFDLAALNAIFSSPVFVSGERPVQGRGEAAYWLPLLALFTGARLEELGQLRPADVAQTLYPDAEGTNQSAWCIRIAEDADGDLKVKNAASERVVPVHPVLAQLGFIRFVEVAAKAGQARLFPSLKPNIYGRLAAKWGEWFGPYLRTVCGVTDKRMVFHSFRHTFKQYARHAGIIEGVQRQIMGHSSSDVADDYGSGYPMHIVVAGMAAYRVPGLALPSIEKGEA